jgi:uncharacterized protein YbaP (TraB family)
MFSPLINVYQHQKTRSFFLGSMGLCFFLVLYANAVAQRTILWRVTDTVHQKTSYLLGTHHYMGNGFVDSLKPIRKHLLESELAVFETAETGEQVVAVMNQRKADYALKKVLDKLSIQQLEFISKDWRVPLYKLQPVELLLKLRAQFYQQVCGSMQPKDTADHFDNYLISIARANQINVFGLETDSLQLNLLQASFEYSWKDAQSEIKYFLAAFEGRADLGDNCDFVGRYKRFEFDYALDTPCDEDPFINDRNQKWMQVLPSLLRSKRCFVAVGLLHLMHNCGLIVELRKVGFVVEPVAL